MVLLFGRSLECLQVLHNRETVGSQLQDIPPCDHLAAPETSATTIYSSAKPMAADGCVHCDYHAASPLELSLTTSELSQNWASLPTTDGMNGG